MADREGLGHTGAVATDDDTLEDLDTGARLPMTLPDLDRVGAERGDVGLHRRLCRVRRPTRMVLCFLRRCQVIDGSAVLLSDGVSPGRVRVTALPVAGPCGTGDACKDQWCQRAVPTKSTPRHTVGRVAINPGVRRIACPAVGLTPDHVCRGETPECAGHRGTPVGRSSNSARTVITTARCAPVAADVVVPDVHDRRRDDRPATIRAYLGDAGDARGLVPVVAIILPTRTACHRRGCPSRLWDPRREHADERTHPHPSADLRGSSRSTSAMKQHCLWA